MLRDAAEKIIGERQADEVHQLQETVYVLRLELADQTGRAEELKTNLELCERNRELNFDTALRLYRNPGHLVLVERRNLIDQIHQLKLEVLDRDSQIWSRDQLIEALRFNIGLYANQEQWVLLRQCFYALQQKYGQLPQDFRRLQQNYEDLEDEHIDVFNRLKKLEGDHTELKAQRDQIKDERDWLENDAETAKQSSAEVASRYWALEIQRDQLMEQKVASAKEARAHEQFLTGLAARLFKRTVFMAGVLDSMKIDTMDTEQIALCQLASQHLGLDAAEITNNFNIAAASKVQNAQEECGGSGSRVPKPRTGDHFSLMPTPECNNRQLSIPLARVSHTSANLGTDGRDVSESPNSFDARRRREVAAAEERLLGPLGLGFEDGSPTLKTKPVPEGSQSKKVSKFMPLFPTSPATPSKTRESHLTSSANATEQVTPARTGGTSGIARDQWRVASNEVQEFTEVFRGPRTQPIDIVSPGVRTKGAKDDSQLRKEQPFQGSDSDAFLSTNETDMQNKNPVEELGTRSDLEDGALHENDIGETSESKDEDNNEDSRHDWAAVLNTSTDSGGNEGGFNGETKHVKRIVTSRSTPVNGKSSQIWKETSFGIGSEEQSFPDYQNPSTASLAATPEPESGAGFATFTSFPKTPLEGGSPTLEDLGVGNEARTGEADATPSLPKGAEKASTFQRFDFGGSSSRVPFLGIGNVSWAPPALTSGPISTGLFDFPSAYLPQAPRTPDDPPRFEQDFVFSGSNGGFKLTASQNTSSTLRASASELGSAGAVSGLGTSFAQNVPTVIAQIEEKAPQKEIEKQGTDNDALDSNTRDQKKSKRKQAKEESQKKEEPKAEGPNRSQRRAASRERRAAEKKVLSAAKDATGQGRRAIAMAMMRG